jgi:hypothetical protein
MNSDIATTTATERVAAAITAGQVPARKDVEHSLRDCWNLSARQAKRFASEGAKAFSTDDNADMLERLRSLELAIIPNTK